MTLRMTVLSALSTLSAYANNSLVYFGTSDAKGIYYAKLDTEKGILSEPQLAIEISHPGFIAIHPNKKQIYSTAAGPGNREGAAAMQINGDGTLTLLNMQAAEGSGGCHVSVDQTGQCLVEAHYGSGSVTSFRILPDGSLSEAKSYFRHEGSGADPQRQDRPHAHSVFMNPANTFAYAADLGIDRIMIYKLDADNGSLSPAGETIVPGGSMGPRHMKWNADGAILYVLNELDLSVSIFRAVENGQLEFIKTVSVLPADADRSEMTCAEMRIHPNGRYVYTSNRDLTDRGRDSITVFTRLEDGFMRLATVKAEVWIPRNFNIDPSGRWMLIGGKKSHDIALFRIDQKTGLPVFTGTRVAFPGSPICIEFLK